MQTRDIAVSLKTETLSKLTKFFIKKT